MSLSAGQRIQTSEQGVYVVGERLSQNGLTSLYAAQKIFFNYRLEEGEFYEAKPEEWIDLRIRTASGDVASKPVDPDQARARLKYEATSVLGRIPGWFPEPVDLFEFDGRPFLVLSAAHGQTLYEWRMAQTAPNALSLRIAGELLNLLDAVHKNGQLLGPFSPYDFQIDEAARIVFTGTHRVIEAAPNGRASLPATSHFIRQGFVAPNLPSANGVLDRTADIYSWAATFVFLLTDWDGESHIDEATIKKVRTSFQALGNSVPNTLRAMSPRNDRRPVARVTECWCRTIEHCLSNDGRKRPTSVATIWRMVMPRNPLGALLRLWRRS